MREATAVQPTSHTLDVPGAMITYDTRDNALTTEPALLLVGSPMGASGFVTLASHFPDRTVVTYDPRGAERSPKSDPSSESTPQQHADDLHRVISAIGGGPVDVFASSGGAVNALALVALHPEDVRILVAHEPPSAMVLDDRDAALAATDAVGETYQKRGFGAGMAHFIALTSHRGPFTDDFAQQPPPDPAMFGMPSQDDGTRSDPLLSQNMTTCPRFEPDIAALRAAPTRIVVAVGAESEGQFARRGGEGVARGLGLTPVIFPSGHGGFLGNEYGMPGEPEAFAAQLREVLAANA